MAAGANLGEKLFGMVKTIGPVFQSYAPGLGLLDLAVGVAGAVILYFVVQSKIKKARKFRRDMEYGSARWGTEADIKPFVDPKFENNVILTGTEFLTMNTRPKIPANARNLNACVIGSSGSGKTRFWLTPQLLQAHSSYVVVDPKGGTLSQCGYFLQKKKGYKVKVFNSIDFSKSMHYNPMAYIKTESDVLKFVNALIANTKGDGKEGDEFWTKAETLLYCALVAYIVFEGPEEERNMNTLVEMINSMEVREDDESFKNAVDYIHSHIYYNSTTLDYTRKFRNFWGSSFALRRLSDRLCLENGLSIVENPKPRSKGKFRNYGEWQAGQKKPLTYQDRLRAAIDTALAKKPADFPAFLSLMEQAGYEVKQRRGAISFRAPGQERFTRLRSDTLGEGYSETDIRAALSGSRQRPGQPRQKINLAIDIQSRLQGKGPSYERWAKVFNLKQMAAALAYLQDNGLTDYEQLEQKATAATEHFHKLSDQIKSTEAALHTNMELKAATVQYAKTRPVFEKYKASKYSKKFLAEHEADIELYRAACADFKAILGGAKLPKMDTLKEEGRKLSEQKKKLYAEYRKTKADMQEVTTIKANIDYLLGYSEPGRKKEQER